MATTQNITVRRIALLAAGAAALGAAGNASALPLINFPPIPEFTISPGIAVVGQHVVFNAAPSYDRDGTLTRFEWDLNNDGVFEVRSPSIRTTGRSFPGPGTYTVNLRVTDNKGATRTKAKQVVVHRRPIALLTADRAVPNVGDVVGYRATGSYDPDGDAITTYSWDLDGNGTFERSSTSPFVQMSFPVSGMQRLSVMVRDARGAFSNPTTLNVRVNKRPTAVVSVTPNPAIVDQQVMLSGASSTDDRNIVKYEWDLDGNGTYETNGGPTPEMAKMFTTLGPNRVGLQVTDDDGAVDQSVATIEVKAAPVRDTTAPKVTITPARVRMHHNLAQFTVTCPATEMSCATTLTLKGRFGSLRGKVLGRTSEVIPGGEEAYLYVPLSKKAVRAILRSGSIKATAIAVAKDASGNTGTVKKQVTIRK